MYRVPVHLAGVATAPVPSTHTTAAAPLMEVPLRTAADLGPLPGHRVPRRQPTTDLAMAPRRRRMAAAMRGVGRRPPMGALRLRLVPAALTAGVTRRAPVAAPTMLPRRVLGSVRPHPRPSVLPLRGHIRRPHPRQSARRRPVLGKVAGAVMPLPPRPWARQPPVPAVATTVRRHLLRTGHPRRRQPADRGTQMTIKWWRRRLAPAFGFGVWGSGLCRAVAISHSACILYSLSVGHGGKQRENGWWMA